MPTFSLSFQHPDKVHAEGSGEQLKAWVAAPFSEEIAQRIGAESIIRAEGNRLLLQGERFKVRNGWVQASRYLILGDKGAPVAALNITQRKEIGKKTVTLASNIYVTPEWRRQGLARSLLEEAKKDHPHLLADSSLTMEGAALLGYDTHTVTATRKNKP